MADENPPKGSEKPAIKANGDSDTDRIKVTPAAETPPKVQIKPAELKKSTTRIDLSKARPPAGSDSAALTAEEMYKRTTIRMDAPRPMITPSQGVGTAPVPQATPQRSTVRIGGSGAPAPVETARIDARPSTVRIDQPTQRVGETQKVSGQTAPIDIVKRTTLRIDEPPAPGAPKGETRRIQLAPSVPAADGLNMPSEMQKKRETTRLDLPPEVQKRQTGRIDGAQPDVFKKRTGPVTVPPLHAPAPAPVTPIQPIQPISPAAASQAGSRPKTILVRRPMPQGAPAGGPKTSEATGTAPGTTSPEAAIAAQARKSETARLDIPKEALADDRPLTRPKTIRIKRPDGTTARKPLTIARPSEGQTIALPGRLSAPVVTHAPAEVGAGWSWVQLVALLVTVVLVYELAAEIWNGWLPMRIL